MSSRFQVVTLFPEMIEGVFSSGVVGTAQQKGLIEISTINPRIFTDDVHQTVDDRPFGGGDGMVMMAEPLQKALLKAQLQAPQAMAIALSPQGERLTDSLVRELATQKDFVLFCGRYAGLDQRFLVKNKVREISIGDYVLSGGELAAAVLIDAVARQLPGVLGHVDSAHKESFREGILEAPLFTRPREWQGFQVPAALLSGNHGRIQEWQNLIGRLVTFLKRPDLKPFANLNQKEKARVLQTWLQLSTSDRQVLGLESLNEEALQAEVNR